jgi:hypothetical protein
MRPGYYSSSFRSPVASDTLVSECRKYSDIDEFVMYGGFRFETRGAAVRFINDGGTKATLPDEWVEYKGFARQLTKDFAL